MVCMVAWLIFLVVSWLAWLACGWFLFFALIIFYSFLGAWFKFLLIFNFMIFIDFNLYFILFYFIFIFIFILFYLYFIFISIFIFILFLAWGNGCHLFGGKITKILEKGKWQLHYFIKLPPPCMYGRDSHKEKEEVAAHRRIYGNFHTKRIF